MHNHYLSHLLSDEKVSNTQISQQKFGYELFTKTQSIQEILKK